MRRLLPCLLLVGCAPDVHIHVYDDDGDDTEQAATDSGFSESGNASNGTNTSGSDPTTDPSGNASNATNASGNDSQGSDTANPTTGDDSQGMGSDTNPTTGDETSGGGIDMYPQPVGGACPDGFGYNADGAFEFCGPPCGEGDSCPDTSTGNVLTTCVFNPESSMAGCVSGMCENPEESCFAGACMLPATHCAPLCSTADAVCPDGMECSNNDVCRFPT